MSAILVGAMAQAQPTRHRARGFSLIELMMVIAIIALLMAIAFPVFGLFQRTANKNRTKAMLGRVSDAMEKYLNDYGLPMQFQGTTWSSSSWPMVAANNTLLYKLLVTTENDPKGRPYPGYLSGDAALRTSDIDATNRQIIDVWGNPIIYIARQNQSSSATSAAQNYGWPTGFIPFDQHRLRFEIWSAGPDGDFTLVRGSSVAATAANTASGVAVNDLDNIPAVPYDPSNAAAY